jgi:hypothetical protein
MGGYGDDASSLRIVLVSKNYHKFKKTTNYLEGAKKLETLHNCSMSSFIATGGAMGASDLPRGERGSALLSATG